MDVVYLCREGENEELRYSLRSLRNLPHGCVWIFGGAPEWIRGAEVVPTDQHDTKYRVTTRAMRAACEHPGVSDPFVLMNDDFYVMEPVAAVPVLHRGPVDAVIADYLERRGRSGYVDGMVATRDLLAELGCEAPLSYELHVPLPVGKVAMLEALEVGEASGIPVLHKRTLYGNLAGIGGARLPDCKIVSARDGRVASRQRKLGPWLSSSDASFAGLAPLLAHRFPRPSPFEPPQAERVFAVDRNGRRYLERVIQPASPR